MKVPVSWLREFVDVPDDPVTVARRLADCGFAVEAIDGDVIDFEITANRPDCLSVYGLAREAAVAFRQTLKPLPSGAGAPSLSTIRKETPGSGTPTVPGRRSPAYGFDAIISASLIP